MTLRKSVLRSTERSFQNVVMIALLTMPTVCVKIATTPEVELRKLASVSTAIGLSMLRAFVKIATSVFTTRRRDPLRRHYKMMKRKALKSPLFRQGETRKRVVKSNSTPLLSERLDELSLV
jgi:hypothetical protein